MEEKISQLSSVVNMLQETVKRIKKFEDENKTLKKQLKIATVDKEALSQAHSETEMHLHKKLEELAAQHVTEIENMKTEIEENRKRNSELHKQVLKKKDAEIQQLKQEHAQEIKEKNNAIARLELEYEGKITKLKEQSSRFNKLSRSSYAPNIQEIFRQKQQYIQKTYEGTISTLRDEILALKEEIQLYKSEQQLQGRSKDMVTAAVQTDNYAESHLLKRNESTPTWYSSLKKSAKSENSQKASNKRRKLFQLDSSYL